MYLYFDENGILKEQINDKATRQGDIGNKIYVYFNSAIEPDNIYVRYRNGNGVLVGTQFDVSTTKVALQIPYNKNRDLKYFNYTDYFDFYVITIPAEVLEVPGATGCTVRFVQDEEDISLSTFAFMIEASVEGINYVASDEYVSLAQYQYLLNVISQFEKTQETREVILDLQNSPQEVTPTGPNYELVKVIILKPQTLRPENIKQGVEIAGVTGTLDDIDYLSARLDNTLISYENNSVTSIHSSYIFYGCASLTTINLPLVTSIPSYMFAYCSSLANVGLLSATVISGNAFDSCTSLTTINLPSATRLDSYAFFGCRALVSIDLACATTIGTNVFYNCTSLANITLRASSVCSLGNTGSIPASASHHVTIYVPSNLISSYQTASNWSNLYNNGYITFTAIS